MASSESSQSGLQGDRDSSALSAGDMKELLNIERSSRREFLVAAGVLASGAIMGCGSSGATRSAGSSSTGTVGAGKTIGVVLTGFDEYSQGVATGVLKALEGTGYGFTGIQCNFLAAREVTAFNSMISKGVAGLVVLPTTIQSSSRGALAAKAAGIPVVNSLWIQPTPGDSAYVGRVQIDGVKGGNLIAQWITKNTPPGKVLVVSGVPGQGFSEQLTQGLTRGLATTGGKWTIAAEQPGQFDRSTAIKVYQDMQTAHPDAKIVVSFAATMGDGIAAFLQRGNHRDVVSITDDCDHEMVRQMKAGWTRASRFYGAANEGFVSAQLLRAHMEHGTTRGVVQLSQGMATASTIDAFIAKYPFFYDNLQPTVHSKVS